MRTSERRASPRVSPRRPVAAKVKASIPARVLDVSAAGMQIELDTALRPNVTCELRIMLEDGDVNLRATVRRCRAWGFGLGEKDQRVLVYRAGVEFAEISPECLDRLRSQLLAEPAGVGTVGDETVTGTTASAAVAEPFPLDEVEPPVGTAGPEVPAHREGPVKIRINAASIRRILDKKA